MNIKRCNLAGARNSVGLVVVVGVAANDTGTSREERLAEAKQTSGWLDRQRRAWEREEEALGEGGWERR